MKAKLVVFPIQGRNWCFTKSINQANSAEYSTGNTSTLKDLWRKICSNGRTMHQNVGLIADFVSDKMNRGWTALEKAPAGSLKNKVHGVGLRLLSRVKPSEIFLKSISKEITNVEIIYPSSLNPRLVRKRLRHIAMRGSIIHSRYFYGSISLLPLTTVFTVLPLPNIPFFWVLFRTYSHWQALKGSERLLLLISDCPKSWSLLLASEKGMNDNSKHPFNNTASSPWSLQPSEELNHLLSGKNLDGIEQSICNICRTFDLDSREVIKFKNTV